MKNKFYRALFPAAVLGLSIMLTAYAANSSNVSETTTASESTADSETSEVSETSEAAEGADGEKDAAGEENASSDEVVFRPRHGAKPGYIRRTDN